MIRAAKTREAILFREYCLNHADFCWEHYREGVSAVAGEGEVIFIIVHTRYLDHLHKCCVKTTTPVKEKKKPIVC